MKRCSSLLVRKTVLSSHIDLTRKALFFSKMSHDFLLASPDMPTRCFRCAKHVSRRHNDTSWPDVGRRGERGGVIRVEITRRRALTPSLERLANKSSTFLADVARGDSSEKQPGRREFRRKGPVDAARGGKTPRRFMARTDGNSLR